MQPFLLPTTTTTAWSTSTGTNSIPVGAFGVPAWVFSSVAVDDPSDVQSTFLEHTDCSSPIVVFRSCADYFTVGFYGLDYSQAHASADDYNRWAAGGTGGGTPTTTTTTTTTSPTPTVTVSLDN